MNTFLNTHRMGLFFLLFGILLSGAAQAEFVVVEDFELLTLGSIGGQGTWNAASSTVVTEDPADSGNQILAVTVQSTLVSNDLLLAQGTTRMVFMRFRFEQQLSGSFGLSHLAAPDEYSDFGPELNLTNASADLSIANGDTLGVYDKLIDLETQTWYNVWLLVDNDQDQTQVWLNTGLSDATAADQLSNDEAETIFGFRTSSTHDLVNFYIKTSSGGSGTFGPLYIDDIYMESTDAMNLTNPVPEPATLVLLGIGAVCLRSIRKQ